MSNENPEGERERENGIGRLLRSERDGKGKQIWRECEFTARLENPGYGLVLERVYYMSCTVYACEKHVRTHAYACV